MKRLSCFVKVILLCIGGLGIATVAVFFPSVRDSIKNAESLSVLLNIQELVHLENAYYEEHGTFIAASPYPNAPVGEMTLWNSGKSGGFAKLGWKPWGVPVSCRYGISAIQTAYPAEMVCPREQHHVFFGYVKPSEGSQEGLAGPWGSCTGKGVYKDEKTESVHVFETIGPCHKEAEVFFEWLDTRRNTR